jgi:hypothetical protein
MRKPFWVGAMGFEISCIVIRRNDCFESELFDGSLLDTAEVLHCAQAV